MLAIESLLLAAFSLEKQIVSGEPYNHNHTDVPKKILV